LSNISLSKTAIKVWYTKKRAHCN